MITNEIGQHIKEAMISLRGFGNLGKRVEQKAAPSILETIRRKALRNHSLRELSNKAGISNPARNLSRVLENAANSSAVQGIPPLDILSTEHMDGLLNTIEGHPPELLYPFTNHYRMYDAMNDMYGYVGTGKNPRIFNPILPHLSLNYLGESHAF